MAAKVTSYKGFKIQQVNENAFNVFTKDEWAYGAYARQVEWESGTLQEAKDFIDSYNTPDDEPAAEKAEKPTKLSPAMQKVLDRHINAEFADYKPQDCVFYMKDGSKYSPMGYGKYSDGTIKLVNNTATLQALADRGYIEILEIGGAQCADTVRLLKHDNTNRSLLETHNMIAVWIYLVNSVTNGEWMATGGHYIEDGNAEYALAYWDNSGCRADISRIVSKETGEEIYNRNKR